MIKLHGYWRSTAAYRVRITLALKQIQYQNISVDLVKQGGQQHGEEYQLLNPQQLVPTLIDANFIINQSMAIIEYLDQKYSQPKLIAGTLQQVALIRSLAQQIACDIHPLNNLRVLQYLKKNLGSSQDLVDEWYCHWIQQGFAAIEKQLETTAGKFCFGNELSIADVFLIPQVYNAHRFNVDMSHFELITGINKACVEIEAFNQARPENQPDAKLS